MSTKQFGMGTKECEQNVEQAARVFEDHALVNGWGNDDYNFVAGSSVVLV